MSRPTHCRFVAVPKLRRFLFSRSNTYTVDIIWPSEMSTASQQETCREDKKKREMMNATQSGQQKKRREDVE